MSGNRMPDQGPPSATQPEASRPAGPAAAGHPRLAETVATLPKRSGVSPVIISGLLRLVEFLIVAISGGLITYVYIPANETVKPEYWTAVPGAALLTIMVFQSLGSYTIPAIRNFVAQGARIVGGYAFVFLAMMATVFFLKMEGVFSRVVFGALFVIGIACLLATRLAFALVVKSITRHGLLDRRTAIVGGGEHAVRLLDALHADRDSDIKICGIFDERADTRSPDIVAGYPKLGGIDDLIAYARHARLDLIIFSLPVTAEDRILGMLRKLWVLPVDIRLSAHMQKLRFRPRNYSYIGALPMFDVADKPFSDWDMVLKAVFDRVVGALLLVVLTPVMLLVALAIKLDSRGPVFFRQKRYGFNNQLIEVFKFRSMYVDQLDPTAAKLVTKNDPRVTRVGRFLRRSSLDELPQLINVVFRGDLSLVGPRPHAVHAKAADRLYDEVVDGYFARHKVKPGITGWAQVNGWRGETDTQEKIQKRVEHDLHYIENWSVLFDLTILALTPIALLDSERAY